MQIHSTSLCSLSAAMHMAAEHQLRFMGINYILLFVCSGFQLVWE